MSSDRTILRLTAQRQPDSDHQLSQRSSFDASMAVDHNDGYQRWLELRFAVPEARGHSRFHVPFYPTDFAALARIMIEADPAAAVHAFGGAMQLAEIERRRPDEVDNEAA